MRYFRRFFKCACCDTPIIFRTNGIIEKYQIEGFNKCVCGEVISKIDMVELFENYEKTKYKREI